MAPLNRPGKPKKTDDLYPEELKNIRYHTIEFQVRWDEMDANGHLNYSSYLDYFSEARVHSVGSDLFAELRKKGIGPVIYKAELDFLGEVFHPDTLHVVTWLDRLIGKTRTSIHQHIYSMQSGKLVSKGHFLAIFIDLKSRKPVRTPHEILVKFGLAQANK